MNQNRNSDPSQNSQQSPIAIQTPTQPQPANQIGPPQVVSGPSPGQPSGIVASSFTPPKTRKKVYILTSAVLIVILIAGAGFFALYNQSEDDSKDTAPVNTSQETNDSNRTVGSEVSGENFDSERKMDIRALHAQLEAYWNETEYYPTLAQINDRQFTDNNFQGADPRLFQDPESQSMKISGKPAANTYAYEPKAADGSMCDNKAVKCARYVLTATLSDQTTYTKKNLF